MPSLPHEILARIFREHPEFFPALLRSMFAELPGELEFLPTSETFSDFDPPEFRVDAVLIHRTPGEKRPTQAVLVEVQLEVDKRKRFSWPSYMAVLRARLKCPVGLVVVTLDDAVAGWCARPIELDAWGTSVVRARVIGPRGVPWVDDIQQAKTFPELAVLSFLAHKDEPGIINIARAVIASSAELDDDRSQLYLDVVLAMLNRAARDILVAEMRLENYEFQSDFAKKYYAQGKAEGKAEGRAEERRQAIVSVLEARQFVVSDDVRRRLDACEDLDKLQDWLKRAATVGSLDELFRA